MTEKEKIEFFLKQSELGASRWDRRRIDEWKVTFIFWAGLLASAKFLREATVQVPLGWLIIGGVLFLALYVFAWLYGLWCANYNDKSWEFFHRAEALRMLAGINSEEKDLKEEASKLLTKKKPTIWKFLSSYSMLFQIAITALIMSAAILIVGVPSKEQDTITIPLSAKVVLVTDVNDANSVLIKFERKIANIGLD